MAAPQISAAITAAAARTVSFAKDWAVGPDATPVLLCDHLGHECTRSRSTGGGGDCGLAAAATARPCRAVGVCHADRPWQSLDPGGRGQPRPAARLRRGALVV